MKKHEIEQLEKYTSEIEMELYSLAFNEIKRSEVFDVLMRFQSQCDFNLFWLYSIAAEVVLHIESVKFLNKIKFKRKLTIEEVLNYDLMIGLKNFKSEKDFKEYLKLKKWKRK